MKKSHLIGIVMIAVAIAVLISISGQFTSYATFSDAKSSSRVVKVAGQLIKDKEMYYNPEKDPNYFSFYMLDADSMEMKVIYYADKPTDFEMSEQVVLTGKMKENEFIASDILLKCPSKYKDQELKVKRAASE